MTDLHKDDILNRMERLDKDVEAVFHSSGRFQIVIVGGGALVLRGYLTRGTTDIDVLGADSCLNELMELYDMNGRVNAFMDNFAYNYQDRVVHVWSGKIIDYYTASLEDIVIAKLCSNRPDDLTDVELIADSINWNTLEYLALDDGELKINILNERRYKDFLESYKDLERRFRQCDS